MQKTLDIEGGAAVAVGDDEGFVAGSAEYVLLVKPLIERIQVAMKPGGIMLAFFHTKDAGPGAPFYRYNIASKDTLELQPARAYKLQRIFNSRHVENLFREYSSIKFFLGRDNIREVLVIR